ncbi:MAG: 30S ribosomal subunit protein S1 [Candidatus Westeberhardia cardiocondylae]|nr:30S ribosomal subunit protein S1 [Candidatus Westeberhardia cardiocondylae]
MKESFSQLFEEFLKKHEIRPGSIVCGTVLSINKNIVLVDAGLKSESLIPSEQFRNDKGEIKIKINDKIDVFLEQIEDGFGETILSREKAKRYESWLFLKKAYEEKSTVLGIINGKVKGGFTIDINGIPAFLPGSLIDIRQIQKDFSCLEGQEIELKIIKLDQKRNNIVVSRRAVVDIDNEQERNQALENLKEGMKIKGIIKNLTNYGAFIDLGFIDGLLHITDMAWKRVKHPSEIVSIGDEILVKVLKFDKEKTRVSLGLKQLGRDPWVSITDRYPVGMKLTGKVTNLTDYGCFVEIEDGIEGLVHISEMDWRNKNVHPSKIVNINDVINIKILDIDEQRHRISLGMKQCTKNPWKIFSNTYKKNDHIKGIIKSITDFGIFVELEHGIDGLVHISDISWKNSGKEIIKQYKQGNEIETVLLQVDINRERISLGVKQLTEDPINSYLLLNKIGSIVQGEIIFINKEKKQIIVLLEDCVKGYLNCSNEDLLSSQNIEKTFSSFKKKDVLKVKLINFDSKNRIINLSLFNEEKKI